MKFLVGKWMSFKRSKHVVLARRSSDLTWPWRKVVVKMPQDHWNFHPVSLIHGIILLWNWWSSLFMGDVCSTSKQPSLSIKTMLWCSFIVFITSTKCWKQVESKRNFPIIFLLCTVTHYPAVFTYCIVERSVNKFDYVRFACYKK